MTHPQPCISEDSLIKALSPDAKEGSYDGVLVLVSAGFFIQNDGLLWFTIPNVAYFRKMCREGAEEVRRIIANMSDADASGCRKRKRNRRVDEIAEAERAAAFMGIPASNLTDGSVSMHSSFLGLQFHLDDMIGREEVLVSEIRGQKYYSLQHGSERRDRRRKRPGRFVVEEED